MKKKFGIIGKPIKHSLSPVLHKYWFDKYGLDASYSIIEVGDKDLNDVIKKINSRSKIIINYEKNHKKEYEHTQANIIKIKKDFNWSPKKNIKETLSSYYKNLMFRY